MGILSDVFGLGASVVSGGVFGLVGSIVGAAAKYFQEKQRQAWEQKKWAYETELLKLQMQARAQETEQELAVVSQRGAWSGLEASIGAESRISGVHRWVNDARALFRPILTLLLWLVCCLVFFALVHDALAGWIGDRDAADLIRYMVFSTFFSASTATVWWFGDRALTPPAMKNR